MRLDAPTLMAVTAFVALIVGALFVVSWRQARAQRALLVWGVAHLVGAAGSTLSSLRLVLPADLSLGVGNAALLLSYGLIWAGVRAFEGRRPRPAPVLVGGVAWIAAWMVPAFREALEPRVVLASLMAGAYCGLSAAELVRGRGEALASRWIAVALLATYALAYLARLPSAIPGPIVPPGTDPLDSPWVAVLCFAGVLYTVALAFVFVALSKERAEREQRRAADTDGLTGAATRRAFTALAERQLAGPGPAALILFDLDHFKRVNDTFGHAAGDAVLAGFAEAARALLPRGAVLARLGGEEFACLAGGLGGAEAVRFAERVRACVAAARPAALPDLVPTVSVGVATTEGGRDFAGLMRRADDALYRAKDRGRNRVECAGLARAARPPPKVERNDACKRPRDRTASAASTGGIRR